MAACARAPALPLRLVLEHHFELGADYLKLQGVVTWTQNDVLVERKHTWEGVNAI